MSKNELELKIKGIDCSGCAHNFEHKLISTEGVFDARINLVYNKLYIEYDESEITRDTLIHIVSDSGYSIVSEGENYDSSSLNVSSIEKKGTFFTKLWDQKELLTTIISGILLGVGALLEFIFNYDLSSMIIYILGVIIGGVFIFRKAYYSIKSLELDINVLMTIASIAALIIGEYIEATSIVFLFSIGELAETFSVQRTKSSIERLIDFAPSEATLLVNEEEHRVLAKSIEIGSTILVKPNERIPLDGEIISGESYINQAPITGESLPVLKKKGDEVFAGTFNDDGIIKIKITKPYDKIFLKRIVELVESSDQRAPVERYIDTFARYYTPIMVLIASLTLFIPPLITGDPFIEWVYKSLIILVISCPCAVVLSTPISIVVALHRSARNGALIKGGAYIESLSKNEVFAFDKTGTLTVGLPEVVEVFTTNNFTEERILVISGTLEQFSLHPIARAIENKLREFNFEKEEVSNFKSIIGKGVEGEINNELWIVGNPRLIIERNLSISDSLATELSFQQSERKTVIIVSTKNEVVGLITISDKMKPHAKGLVCELKELNIKKIVMLTGDNSKITSNVAKELEIDEYYAELLPDQKMTVIKELTDKYGYVAMIGDGINDAPSLALANPGIAMGASGSDIAVESADIALMTDHLDSLHYLFTLSKKTMRIIKENIFIAIAVKMLLFILSYFGFVTLWMAVLVGDMGLSLFVILNALLRVKGKKMSHLKCDRELCFIGSHSVILPKDDHTCDFTS